MNTILRPILESSFASAFRVLVITSLISWEWRADFFHLASIVFNGPVRTAHTKFPIEQDSAFESVIVEDCTPHLEPS